MVISQIEGAEPCSSLSHTSVLSLTCECFLEGEISDQKRHPREHRYPNGGSKGWRVDDEGVGGAKGWEERREDSKSAGIRCKRWRQDKVHDP